MTKTAAPRVRQVNLYTVESDGQPVAQAMAISQAEAVRLYVESVQQPTMTARLSSPLEARTLAGLPLLTRGEPVRDTATPDLFGDVPAAAGPAPVADHVEDARAMVEPLAAGGFAPCGRALGDCGKAAQTCGRDGCGVEVVDMPPQRAPIEAATEGLASGADDQPGESVAGDCAEPASTPADASLASADAPTLSERMAGAYAAGVEMGKHGLGRLSDEMLTAEREMLRAARGRVDADAVHAEMLRGFEDGRVQVEPVGTQPSGWQHLDRTRTQAALAGAGDGRRQDAGRIPDLAFELSSRERRCWFGRSEKT